MAKIPTYTEIKVVPRATPQLYDPSAIQAAGSFARGVSDVSGFAGELAFKQAQAQAATEADLAVTESKKRKLDLFDSISKENMSNPVGFSKKLEEESNKLDEELSKGLSGLAASSFKNQIQDFNVSLYKNGLEWENKRQTEQHAERIEASVNNLSSLAFRAGKDGMGFDSLQKDADATLVAASTFVSPEKLSEMKRKIDNGLVKEWLSGISETNPAQAKKILDSKKYDSALGNDLDSVYNSVETKIKSQQAEFEKQAAQASADLDVAIALTDDEKQLNEIKSKVESLKGTLPPSSYASKLIKIDAKIKGIGKQVDKDLEVSTKLNSGAPLDISDKDVKKAIENQYAGVVSNVSTLPKAEQNEAKAQFVAKIGFVPDPLKNEVNAGLRSQNPDDVLHSVALVESIRASNPYAVTDLKDDSLRVANSVQANINLGYSPKDAVKKSREDLIIDENTKQTRKADFLEFVRSNPSENVLGNKFNNLLVNDPEFPSMMIEDYSDILQKEFVLSGNMEAAQITAMSMIEKEWARSKVGSGGWMKNAPERVYGAKNRTDEENSGWMRKDLYGAIQHTDVAIQDVLLGTPNKDGRYPLMVLDGGLVPLLDKNGLPLLWKPDRDGFYSKYGENK